MTPMRRIRCPQCNGAGRRYETDEAGDPCMMCREDGCLYESEDPEAFQDAIADWAECGVSDPPFLG